MLAATGFLTIGLFLALVLSRRVSVLLALTVVPLAAALLLGAVGVRDDAIVADYARTDQNMFRVLQRLELAPALPPGVTEEDVRRDIVS